MDRGAWRAMVHEVTKSQTGLSDEHTCTHPLSSAFDRPEEARQMVFRWKLSRALWGSQAWRPFCPPFLVGKTSVSITFLEFQREGLNSCQSREGQPRNHLWQDWRDQRSTSRSEDQPPEMVGPLWVSLVAQLVKTPPAMWETWV